jgi:hypothetical protein
MQPIDEGNEDKVNWFYVNKGPERFDILKSKTFADFSSS